jgi:hypothetical protein
VRYAIADVPTFVRPAGLIDIEARRRGHTIYAPDHRTPLHPEVIGEDVASLLPNQVRPAFVWDMQLDPDGDGTAVEVYRAMVSSKRRLDYAQVQEAVDDATAEECLILLNEVGERRLSAAQHAGIGVVLVTARPPRWLHDLGDLVGEHGVVLCANGAFVYDARRRRILDERCLPAGVVVRIAEDLRNALPGIVFAVENRIGFMRQREFRGDHTTAQDVVAVLLEEMLDPLPGKMLARSDSLLRIFTAWSRMSSVIGPSSPTRAPRVSRRSAQRA